MRNSRYSLNVPYVLIEICPVCFELFPHFGFVGRYFGYDFISSLSLIISSPEPKAHR